MRRYISRTNAVVLQISEVSSINFGNWIFFFFMITDSSVDIFPDYVCVLDLGMFELSLFTCDGSEQVRSSNRNPLTFFMSMSSSIKEIVNNEWESSCVHEGQEAIAIVWYTKLPTCPTSYIWSFFLCIKCLMGIKGQTNLRKLIILVKNRRSHFDR